MPLVFGYVQLMAEYVHRRPLGTRAWCRSKHPLSSAGKQSCRASCIDALHVTKFAALCKGKFISLLCSSVCCALRSGVQPRCTAAHTLHAAVAHTQFAHSTLDRSWNSFFRRIRLSVRFWMLSRLACSAAKADAAAEEGGAAGAKLNVNPQLRGTKGQPVHQSKSVK